MRLRLEHVAREADRYGLSDRATATICTALLCDIGLVNETDQTMIIDKNKIRRERNAFRNKLINDSQQPNDTDEPITAIYFDGRKDQTLVHLEDAKGLKHIKEEHYVLVEQPHGEYLTHLTLQSGSAAAISNAILEFTGNHDISDTLKVLGCDSTNVNTGSNGGVIHLIERKIGHKVMWLICLLHTNELPLRHLFTKLDGKTTGKDCFSGV